MVHDATGSADKDVQTGTDGTGLRTVRDAPMEAGGVQTERLGDGVELLLDLPGQFSGGTEDDHGHAPTALHATTGVHEALLLGQLDEARYGRQTERQGLARTGTRAADDVPAGNDGAEGLGLHGG